MEEQKENKDDIELDIKLPKFKKWNDLPIWRRVIAIVLLIFIFTLIILCVVFKDKIVTNTEILGYPDGCNETWINGIINSSNCTQGRAILELHRQNSYRVGAEVNPGLLEYMYNQSKLNTTS